MDKSNFVNTTKEYEVNPSSLESHKNNIFVNAMIRLYIYLLIHFHTNEGEST